MSVLIYSAINNNQINFVSIFYPHLAPCMIQHCCDGKLLTLRQKKKVNILSSKVYNEDLQSSNSLLVAFIQFN